MQRSAVEEHLVAVQTLSGAEAREAATLEQIASNLVNERPWCNDMDLVRHSPLVAKPQQRSLQYPGGTPPRRDDEDV